MCHSRANPACMDESRAGHARSPDNATDERTVHVPRFGRARGATARVLVSLSPRPTHLVREGEAARDPGRRVYVPIALRRGDASGGSV
jgi:hypothetical protein